MKVRPSAGDVVEERVEKLLEQRWFVEIVELLCWGLPEKAEIAQDVIFECFECDIFFIFLFFIF